MTYNGSSRQLLPAGARPACGLTLRTAMAGPLLAGLLSGCATMPDIVNSTVPVGQEKNGTAFTSVAQVKARVVEKKQDLASRINNEALKRQGLGGLIFAGLATAGLGAAYGAHTDLIVGGGATAGLAFAAGQLGTERGYDAVYLAGITALNCVDATISPIAGSHTMLKQRKEELDAAIAGLDAVRQSAQALGEQFPRGANAQRLKAYAATFSTRREEADESRKAAELRFAAEPELANSAVPALIAIDNELGRQVLSLMASLENYFTALQNAPGLRAGPMGNTPPGEDTPDVSQGEVEKIQQNLFGAEFDLRDILGTVKKDNGGAPQPPVPPSDISAALLNDHMKALDAAAKTMAAAKAPVDALNQKLSSNPDRFDLSACAYLAPELAVADISFDPSGDALKVKQGGHLVVQIKGGGKSDSFGAFLQQNVQDLQVTPVGLRMLRIGAGTSTPKGAHAIIVSSTVSGRTALLNVTVE